jgi:hypothetical protein
MVTALAVAHLRGIGNSYRTCKLLKNLVSTRCENFHGRGPLVALLVFSLLFALPRVSNCEMCTTEDEVHAIQWYLRKLEEGVAVVVRASAPCWTMTSLSNPSLGVIRVDGYLHWRNLTLRQVTLPGGGGGAVMVRPVTGYMEHDARGLRKRACCGYALKCCWETAGARRRGCDRSTGFASQPAGCIAMRCTRTSYK